MKNENNQLFVLVQSFVGKQDQAKMKPVSIVTFIASLQAQEALVNCRAARSAKNEKVKPDPFLKRRTIEWRCNGFGHFLLATAQKLVEEKAPTLRLAAEKNKNLRDECAKLACDMLSGNAREGI